jgi:hypothetical protein
LEFEAAPESGCSIEYNSQLRPFMEAVVGEKVFCVYRTFHAAAAGTESD